MFNIYLFRLINNTTSHITQDKNILKTFKQQLLNGGITDPIFDSWKNNYFEKYYVIIILLRVLNL